MENQTPLDLQLGLSIEVSDKRLVLAPAGGNYKYCLIWLHGMNMSVQRFYNVFLSEEMIGLLKDFKIILPQAPIAPVTVEGGKSVFSWFNVTQRKFGKPFDELFGRQEILDNSKTIIDIIDTEAKQLGDYSKVFLGGFSQGCALSLYTGLSIPQKLGGIIGYAGYLFEITPELSDDRNVLIIHGHKDQIRPWTQVEHTYAPIKDKENVKFLFYPTMGHDLYCDEARKAVTDFIRERCT